MRSLDEVLALHRPPLVRPLLRLVTRVVAACALAVPHRAMSAQSMPLYVPTPTAAAWRTFETPHFVFHYPAQLDTWTRDAATRMEAERDAVTRLVGYAPPGRVTVLVADPYNASNGSAYPFLRAPAVFLWPVPADPRDQVGTSRRWAELLTVHEYAHIAQLTRPTRNPLRARLAALLPTNIGPIGAKTPRWVWEGYATYVEGKLTGSGRPYGVWRPAFLREWAIEGRLPSYAAVSGTGGFGGGSFAYLAGSAFLEWLVAQRGDSSLPAVWRRLTARTRRSFDAAFAGVFPGTPAELYARWSAEVTAEAVAAERAVRGAGFVEGTLVQRLRGATGDPAVSPDGQRVALVVRSPGRASRIVVWRTGAEPRDTARERAQARVRARQRARDPEDVPAVPYLPPPKRALATLPAHAGRAFRSPRWLPDGAQVLVERDEPLADGTLRPDLWVWHTKHGSLRRVTHGAGARDADPAPNGNAAIATWCLEGWCDVVRVDLASGAVSTLVEGTPLVSYARPRWAPDGRHFVVSVQAEGRWHVAFGDATAPSPEASLRRVGPDDGASRYDAAFLSSDTLLVTSELGGVPNVERVDLASGAVKAVTRVTGAAVAPEPIARQRAFYFLSLRSTGLDLRRVSFDSVPALMPIVPLAGATTGATRIAARVATGPAANAAAAAVEQRVAYSADTFPPSPVGPARPYGLGPHHVSLLPGGAYSPDGVSALGILSAADPVGRLTWVLLGAYGEPATWRGGSLSAALRALPFTVEAQAFGAAQRLPAPLRVERRLATGREADRYAGGVVAVAPRVVLGAGTLGARLGGSLGTLTRRDGVARDASDRALGFAEARAGVVLGRGDVLLSAAASGSGAAGRSGDEPFTRWLGAAGVGLRTPLVTARGSFSAGEVTRGSSFERFLVGGTESALVDQTVLGQRVPMPALATGTLAGAKIQTARVGVTSGLLEPYAWAGRAPDVSRSWLRVVGAEATFTSGPIPFARAPGVHIVAGAAYPLDGATRHRVQAYASVVARP